MKNERPMLREGNLPLAARYKVLRTRVAALERALERIITHPYAHEAVKRIARNATNPEPIPREYRGVVIMPMPINSGGLRWEARLPSNTRVVADTLAGIKRIIRTELRGDTCER